MKKYDCIIVGAGIAGLAIAEFFSRQGKSVIVLEMENSVCSKASADHHGWFHMGSLYSIFWKNNFMRTLIGGLEDLLEYYSSFSRMNLSVDDNGKLKTENTTGDEWFTNDNINYLLACKNDSDFKFLNEETFLKKLKKLVIRFGWQLHVRKFVARHAKFNNYQWLTQPQTASSDIPNVNFWSRTKGVLTKFNFKNTTINPKTHISVRGFDATMRSQNIIKDLVASLNNTGGIILTGLEVKDIAAGESEVVVKTANKQFKSENVILAAGSGLNSLKLEKNESYRIRKLISPLLVVRPPIFEKNFVRMTPFVQKSINHLKHELNSVEYSVVGGGFELPDTATEKDKAEIESNLIETTESTFKVELSKLKHKIYWGNKTEVVFENTSRNYQYNIQDINKRTWIAVPGKFSLAFSLAVNSYKKIYGEIDTSRLGTNNTFSDSSNIPKQSHTRIAEEL